MYRVEIWMKGNNGDDLNLGSGEFTDKRKADDLFNFWKDRFRDHKYTVKILKDGKQIS